MLVKILNILISIVGIKKLMKKYIISSETLLENGKKITILTLDGKALLKDGATNYHLAGGLCATVGSTVIVLDCVKPNTTANDFGFFLNHEVGHLVLGHVDKAVKAGKGGTILNIEDEVAADNYARNKGFSNPDFNRLLTGVYGELASVGFISADDIPGYVEATLKDHESRM